MTKKNAKPTMAEVNRKLAREWHPAKNAPLTPKDVGVFSNKKVWWVCKKGHEWRNYISSRSRFNIDCPYCSGRRATDENCLQTVNPRLAGEWHHTRNAPLTPGNVTAGAYKKAWWICNKGHEWEAHIYNRSRKGTRCPYCAGLKVNKDNCLQTKKPALARQWHPTKNAPLTPKDIAAGTRRKVWWLCRKGHEWQSSVYNISNGRGCPYCAGKRTDGSNCLKTLNPKLARQWHPAKNSPLTPRDVTPNSGKKVWWKCRAGHEWLSIVANRTKGLGCPYCAGQKATEETCLQALNPMVARQWHPTKNAPLTPRDVRPGSSRKVWWVCQKGHEWEARIHHRNAGVRCPYCSGLRATKETCLQSGNPMIAGQWHPIKNAPLTPWDVKPWINKKMWWVCRRGHEWAATVGSRSRGNGCPFCSGDRPTKENSLEFKSPWLAREWHPTKNDTWTPRDVTPYSQRQVWWKCKKGHERRESVIDRYRRCGCPVCVLKRKAPQLFERVACRS